MNTRHMFRDSFRLTHMRGMLDCLATEWRKYLLVCEKEKAERAEYTFHLWKVPLTFPSGMVDFSKVFCSFCSNYLNECDVILFIKTSYVVIAFL